MTGQASPRAVLTVFGSVASRKRRESVRVLIVDDHPLVIEGLRRYLNPRRDIEVIAQASDGEEALQLARDQRPQIVLMDVDMPRMSGVEATRRLRSVCPDARVIGLTGRGMEHVNEMQNAGAWGYLVKSEHPSEVARAILAVSRGDRLFEEEAVPTDSGEPDPSVLTPRERQVLVLIAQGKSNKEIGQELGIGVRTVETHRENLTRKLRVRGAAALTKWAIAHKLVDLAT